MRELIANIQNSGDWCVHFLEADAKTGVGPWLIFDTEQEVLGMLKRVDVDPGHLQAMLECLVSRSYFPLHIRVNDEQYTRLVAAGIRDPRTGYEKRKARGR